MKPSSHSLPTPRSLHRQRAQSLGLVLFAAVVFSLGVEHPAYAYMGEGIVDFARMYVIAPLGLIAVLVALGASVIRPDMVRSAGWAAIVCAAMFMVMTKASDVIAAVQR